MSVEVHLIPAFQDNYLWLARTSTGFAFAIDPGDAGSIIDFLEQKNWSLNLILNTHHHPDHVGGNLELKQKYSCPIWGALADSPRLPGVDRGLTDGEVIQIGETSARVMAVPGHTRAHIAFYFNLDNLLFIGDTLFGLGCGRLFEGTPAEMLSSLKKVSSLPDETLVYCAHEYTESNLKFSLEIIEDMPDEWPELIERSREILALRANQRSTVPFSLREEKQTNLFLNTHRAVLQKRLSVLPGDDLEAFARLRQLKDTWQPR